MRIFGSLLSFFLGMPWHKATSAHAAGSSAATAYRPFQGGVNHE